MTEAGVTGVVVVVMERVGVTMRTTKTVFRGAQYQIVRAHTYTYSRHTQRHNKGTHRHT
jgi:hypothetical protein